MVLEVVGESNILQEVAQAQGERATALENAGQICAAFESGTYKRVHVQWIPQSPEFNPLRQAINLALDMKEQNHSSVAQQWGNVRQRLEDLTTSQLQQLNTAFNSKGQ